MRVTYWDVCNAQNITQFASFVDPGFVTISAPLQGLNIEDNASITITVIDADLNTDAFTPQVQNTAQSLAIHARVLNRFLLRACFVKQHGQSNVAFLAACCA